MTLATASITGHEARGTASIVIREGGRHVLRLTDLWVAPGAPDVRLYLAPTGDVSAADTVDLGPIATVEGTRDVALPEALSPPPAGTDVVIHCTVYSVEFGRGALR